MTELFHTSPLVNVFNADCVEFLRDNSCKETVDFVCTDPPFNIGQDYDVHDDKLADQQFRDWYFDWFMLAANTLKTGGVFAINVPDDLVEHTLVCARWCGLHRINWCIWHYKFGQCHDYGFISSHTHCLIFSTGHPHTWNPQDILIPSDRAAVYDDARTNDSATPGMRVPLDVFSIDNNGPNWGRIVGNNLEKIPGHPNQLPEKYLELLIRAYTNPNDLVLDCFGGTGTTGVVAQALGRRCILIEKSKAYCEDIKQRLIKGAVRC